MERRRLRISRKIKRRHFFTRKTREYPCRASIFSHLSAISRHTTLFFLASRLAKCQSRSRFFFALSSRDLLPYFSLTSTSCYCRHRRRISNAREIWHCIYIYCIRVTQNVLIVFPRVYIKGVDKRFQSTFHDSCLSQERFYAKLI